MGIPDHLTCLLRNLYVGQEATIRTLYGTTDWFEIKKGVQQCCLLSPYILSTSWNMLSWMNSKLGSDRQEKHHQPQICGGWYHSHGWKWRGTKEPLVRVKEGSERVSLKLSIKKKKTHTKIMAFDPITAWQIEWGKVEVVTKFLFLGSKINADGYCSHEIRRLASWQESYDKPRECIMKQRHYSAQKGLHSQAIVFPVVTYIGWEVDHKEDRTPKNWCFELWCWRRLLKVPWTATRSNQSFLREINPE